MENLETKTITCVDVMETWRDLQIMLFVYLVTVMAGTDFVVKPEEPLLLCICAVALALFIMWSPGMLMMIFLDMIYARLAATTPAYAKPQGISFRPSKIRANFRREVDSLGTGIVLVAMLLLSALIIILSIVSVFLQDELSLVYAVRIGISLSWGGALIIGARLIYDAIWARWLKKS